MLYVVATPIGNLDDISQRAITTLNQVDFVFSEDTRTTNKLLNSYDIETRVESFHQHSAQSKIDYALDLLEQGKDLALVSESGTPVISDPGARLIDQVYQKGYEVVPIPGPSALTAAASVSGFPMNEFLFLGFPPKKNKRKRFFQEVADSKIPVILYESPHRIIKTLSELQQVVDSGSRILVGRELTKKFESIYRGPISKVIKRVEQDPIKGEYTIVVGK